jgi:PAS domain S-box-containing protein
LVRPDGTRRSVEASVSPIKAANGSINGFRGTVRDITERKRADEALRESQQLLEKTLSSLLDAVFIIDSDTLKIIDCNSAASAIFGYSRKEMLSRTTTFLHVDQASLEEFRHHLNSDVEKKGFLFMPEFRMKRKDGTVFPSEHSVIPLENEQGKRIGWVSVVRDITERRQAEEEIRQLNADLEQRVEQRTRELREAQEKLIRQEKLAVLGQLAGGVGHELRNPLGVINTSIYYLKLVQPEAVGKVRQHLDMIEQEVHNAEKIITDLLDFARVISADREPVSVPELVRGVLARYSVPPAVKVALKLPAGLPKVFADPRQMEQILGNLVTNAWQAMIPLAKTGPLGALSQKGTGTVSSISSRISYGTGQGGTLTISAQQKKELVVIAVKDTGTGITPENLKKLFEPLFTTKAKGIGLGLAVSQKLAEANGGRIEVESEPGKGSTFTLVLPVSTE